MASSQDFKVAGVSGKTLTGSEWTAMEVKLSEFDKKILGMLKESGFGGKSVTLETEGQLSTLGALYGALRADAKVCKRIGMDVEIGISASTEQSKLKLKPKSKGGASKVQKKGISAEEIRHRKLMEKYDIKRDEFLSSWNRTHWEEIPSGKANMPIESLVLDFLQHIDGFCKNIKKIEKSRIHDLIFGCAKFLENLKVIQVRNCETNKFESPNPMLISDLETKLEELKLQSRFSITKASAETPKFLVKTSYDGVLPGMTTKPYESQTKLIEAMYANKDNGLLACLNTLTGEGKTTLIVAVAAILQSWNRSSSVNSVHYEVIYCSSQKLKTIEIQVGQNAWNAQIPFGTAVVKRYADRPDKVKLCDNYNCRKFKEDRVLTIADIASTIKLMEQQIEDKKILPSAQATLDALHQQVNSLEDRIASVLRGAERLPTGETVEKLRISLGEMRKKYSQLAVKVGKIVKTVDTQYVLFFDEPTVDLDLKASPMVSYLAQIFNLMPKFTILSTATAPERESIPLLEEIFVRKFPSATVDFIKSSKVRIGSEISDLDGNIFIPHANCVKLDKYECVVSKIESDCFLQKCYTPNVVNELFSKLKKLCVSRGFVFPSELDFESYLNTTSNMNQDAICKLAIKYLKFVIDVVSTVEATEADAIITEFCSSRFSKRGVSFGSLATSAEQFESQTLIVSANPAEFFETHFGDYVSNARQLISKANEFDHTVSFNEIFQAYCAKKDLYAEKKDEIEKSKSKSKSNSKSKTQDRDMDGADHEAQRKIRLDALGPIPGLSIPDRLVIGSSSYMKERGLLSTLKTFTPELVNWAEIECTESQKLGLCLGVGLYSRSYDSSYTKIVLDLASKGKLAYLIADDVICYGTNYPIENVIVDNTCLTAEAHSVKTVFQVFARAGRPGKSWRANVFAHPSVLEMIQNYIHNSEFVDIEVQNMNKALMHSVLDSVISKKVANALKLKQRYIAIQEANVQVEREAKEAVERAKREAKEVVERAKREAKEVAEREAEEKKNSKWSGGRWSTMAKSTTQSSSSTGNGSGTGNKSGSYRTKRW